MCCLPGFVLIASQFRQPEVSQQSQEPERSLKSYELKLLWLRERLSIRSAGDSSLNLDVYH
jgi:hypothetical protein